MLNEEQHSRDILRTSPILTRRVNNTSITKWVRGIYNRGDICALDGALWESIIAKNTSRPPENWRKLT